MNAMKLAVMAATLSVAVATSALAAPTTYKSDDNHTYVRFSYSHLGFSTQEQRFNKVSGTVTFDPVTKDNVYGLPMDYAPSAAPVFTEIAAATPAPCPPTAQHIMLRTAAWLTLSPPMQRPATSRFSTPFGSRAR